MTRLLGLALVLFLAGAARADAQSTTTSSFVTIADFAVEDRPPPSSMAHMLDDETRGVIHDLEACYATSLAARAGVAGELPMRLYVSAREVIRATPSPATFDDAALVQCTKQTLLRFRLPPEAPDGGAYATFRVRFTPPPSGTTLSCQGTRCSAVACGAMGQPCCAGASCGGGLCNAATLVCAPPPPPPVQVATTRARGALTADEVTAAIAPSLFASCQGTASGTTTVSLAIAKNGSVRVTMGSGSLRDRTTRTCLRDALRTVTFPTRTRTTSARLALTVPASP